MHKCSLDDALLAAPKHCIENVLSPRFSVEQGARLRRVQQFRDSRSCMSGFKPDGSVKVRPIDDLTASEINKNTYAAERVTNDTLDKLVECMRDMYGRKEGGFGVRTCFVT